MNIFKVMIPGFSVRDKDPQSSVLNRLYPSPKIDTTAKPPHAGIIHLNYSSDVLKVPAGQVIVMYSFPHGYNYVPTVLGSHVFDNGSTIVKGVLPFQNGSLGMVVIDADSVNINLKWVSLDGTTTISPFVMQIHFYVMAERGHI